MDMDWDDEDEATHIFDKADEGGPKVSGSPRPAAGNVTPPPPAAAASALQTLPSKKSTLLGMTMPMPQAPNLGMTMPMPQVPQARPSAPPPPPASVRPPPPPPTSSAGGAFARASGGSVGTPGPSGFPPPPTIDPSSAPPALYGQTVAMGDAVSARPAGQPMGAPPSARPRPPSAPPPAKLPPPPSAPAQPVQASDYPAPLPPPNRMEATAVVRPPTSRTGIYIAAALFLLALIATVFAIYFFVLPKNAQLTVTLSDKSGAKVTKGKVYVNGSLRCDFVDPCLLPDLAAGTYKVRVVPQDFDTPPEQEVKLESRAQMTLPFIVEATAPKVEPKKAVASVGLKVSGKQIGVKLYVDGEEKGPLPQELNDLQAGEHKIRDRRRSLRAVRDVGEPEGRRGERSRREDAQGAQGQGDHQPAHHRRQGLSRQRERTARAADPADLHRDSLHRELVDRGIEGRLHRLQAGHQLRRRPGREDLHDLARPEGHAAPTATQTTVAQVPPQPTQAPQLPPQPTQTVAVATTAAPTTAPPPPQPAGEAYLNINSIPPSSCFLDGRSLGSTPRRCK